MNFSVIPSDKFKREAKRLIKKFPSLKQELAGLSAFRGSVSVQEQSPIFSLLLFDKNKESMLIERTSSEVIIRLPASVDTTGLQRLVDYLTYKEATANSKATQEQVDALSDEVKKGWWKKNRKRFIK
jgi:hypothetical protein